VRIGVMLRSLDEFGGVSVYARNVTEELLRRDRDNHYVLFYRSSRHLGSFSTFGNVTEVVLPSRSKAFWDQVKIPRACRRENVDVLFHPKFTVPIFSPCPSVMVVHGADWFMPDQAQFYPWWDVLYIKAVMPLYFRRAAVVLSVSQLTTDNFERVLSPTPGKVRTVYFGPARHFGPVVEEETRSRVREKYQLPDLFLFTLTKRAGDKRKNLHGLFEGYGRYHASHPNPLQLVVVGKDCHLFRAEYALDSEPYGRDVLFPGWIDQEDLPALYSSALLFLYPSNLEAFPIPITEAMACGTPIVTSDVNGLQEIAGDAALLVDPRDPAAIAAAISSVQGDPSLRCSLARAGLERSKRFTWDRCAQQTFAVLLEVGGGAT
jgi:glycosyltransferase involved in cell wall biosynthesis